jgi:tetratricopeptide (TPR) repeat protein
MLSVATIPVSGKVALEGVITDRDGKVTDTFRTAEHRSFVTAAEALGKMIAAAVHLCNASPPAGEQRTGKTGGAGSSGRMKPLIADLTTQAQEHLDKAVKHYDQGDFRASVEEWKKYLAIIPKDPYGHSNLGVTYIALDQWSLAAKAFDRSIRLNRQNDIAWYNLGFCYWKLGRERDARSALIGALKVNPGHEKAQKLLEHLNAE